MGGKMYYHLKLECGHDRLSRSKFEPNEKPEEWEGSQVFCDVCKCHKMVVKLTPAK